MSHGLRCEWCGDPIGTATRADARYCSQRCRQSSWRFTRHRRIRAAAAQPQRLAYADPPYLGKSHYYRDHPDYAGEVDHAALLETLDGYDGWALSASATSLPTILRHAPAGTRVAAWFRGERPAPHDHPLSAWEPVLYQPARPIPAGPGPGRRIDALVYTARPRRADPDRVIGQKPAAFIWWLFELLGARPGDTLDDLYPGSGGVARAWDLHQRQLALFDESPTAAGDESPRDQPDG